MAQIENTAFPGIYKIQKGKRSVLLTKSLAPGKKVYDEKTVRKKGVEYREWDARRSKLAAAVLKGLNQLGLRENQMVLYLGGSTGTTVSHVADVVGKGGAVFAVEVSRTVCRDLVFVAEQRKNVHPILADARRPEKYADRVLGADFLYQDIAVRDQVTPFLKNIEYFLKPGSFAVLCLKARSVDISKHPSVIFKDVRTQLEKELIVADARELSPFQKDHMFYVCKKRM